MDQHKVKYEETHLDLAKKEHKTGEYKKINPFEKVPALIEADGFIVLESATILRYLVNSRGDQIPQYWYPTDPKVRSNVDLFFDWFSANVGDLTKYNYVKLGFSSTPLEEAKQATDKATQFLEEVFVSRHKFLATDDKPTIADVEIAWHLAGLVDLGYEFSSSVKKYYDTLLQELPGLKEDINSFLEERTERAKQYKAMIDAKKNEGKWADKMILEETDEVFLHLIWNVWVYTNCIYTLICFFYSYIYILYCYIREVIYINNTFKNPTYMHY